MSLNAYNPKTKRWEEFETFPQTYHEDGDFWHWANGFVYCGGRWVHAWRTVDTTVSIPTVSGTYTYTRDSSGAVVQTVQFNNFDTEHSEIVTAQSTTQASAAGTYSVVFKLKDRHSQWSDGTTGTKTVQWTIAKRVVTVPTVSGSYTFTKSNASTVLQHTVSFTNYNTLYEQQDNDSTATAGNSGTYNVYFSLKDTNNIMWSDSSTARKVVQWTINKRTFNVPYQAGSLTYNGYSQSPSWYNYNANYMTKSESAQTNAGTYSSTFGLINKNDTLWSDTTTENKTANWTIGKQLLSKPYVSGTPTYTGGTIDITYYLVGFDSNKMSIYGNTATNAGSYTATVSLSNTTNYGWYPDGSTGSVSLNWYISKKSISFSLGANYSPFRFILGASTDDYASFVYNGQTVNCKHLRIYWSEGVGITQIRTAPNYNDDFIYTHYTLQSPTQWKAGGIRAETTGTNTAIIYTSDRNPKSYAPGYASEMTSTDAYIVTDKDPSNYTLSGVGATTYEGKCAVKITMSCYDTFRNPG